MRRRRCSRQRNPAPPDFVPPRQLVAPPARLGPNIQRRMRRIQHLRRLRNNRQRRFPRK